MANVTNAYTITDNDGVARKIPGHSNRIYLAKWPNKAIEVLVYTEQQSGEDLSDRIHLLIHAGQAQRGWLMNVEDAVSIIAGLSAAIEQVIVRDIPVKPVENFQKEG